MILETDSGVLVNVETSVNIRYGYDIRGEVVGEDGTAALADTGPIVLRSAHSVGVAVPEDWRERFIAAYDVEFQEWINEVVTGTALDRPECLGRLRRAGRLRRRRRSRSTAASGSRSSSAADPPSTPDAPATATPEEQT